MSPARSVLRTILFVLLLVAAWLDGRARSLFFGMTPGPEGAVWVHHWCRRFIEALGIRTTVEGIPPAVECGPIALVSNHLSYLDILVYSAATPFLMVAKAELRAWPLLGFITAQAGTVYVERADHPGGRTQTHAQVNALMARAFRSGLPVLFFPEGTTTAGDTILPFRRGLFHAVLHDRVQVRSAALAFTLDRPNQGASIANHICFWGDMLFCPHLFAFLGLRGVQAHLRFDSREIPGDDRFALSANARQSVIALYTDLLLAHPAQHPEPSPSATPSPAIPTNAFGQP